ncbi:dual specificity protein phosphatase, putative [Entamoeba invadens IP1]|uniref:protein-tyrosine-phosphatase n=1 Tax=Entamoeba invadens IP1 TaxID=370355 RepID=A0A0A1TZ73_ENTIV|nr:dual specificity protein phosphatase, putative [Entamoeba invadens IP1]ELP86872.1 dual specificity protein phosphatase, putative [Entamoeba invadens IP1]|eukprot:XP_004253643.1 dual specificity protein phosphatase, putative [Entamoeba invadens IP1]
MQRRKDVGINFSKKRLSSGNMLKHMLKYLSNQQFITGDVKSFVFQENGLKDVCVFSMFSNLQEIDLSNNQFCSVPRNLTTITQLKSLNLSQNKIVDGLECLSSLVQLTSLDLSNNLIEEFDFTMFTQLTNVKVFKIANNRLKQFDYNTLTPLKSLSEFVINTNYIDAPMYRDMTQCLLFPSPYFQITPSQVNEKIYLGSLDSTRERDVLLARNISGILSLGVKAIVVSKKIKVEFIPIDDDPCASIDQTFPRCFNFIDAIFEDGGAVLIHCHAGISRSSTVLIAYLMFKNMWTYRQALTFVKSKRPIICPNSGFERQLLCLENKMFNVKNEEDSDEDTTESSSKEE